MVEGKLVQGRVYRRVDGGRFPFDCPRGIYVETSQENGFLRFVWDGKDLLVNGGEFEEDIVKAEVGRDAKEKEERDWARLSIVVNSQRDELVNLRGELTQVTVERDDLVKDNDTKRAEKLQLAKELEAAKSANRVTKEEFFVGQALAGILACPHDYEREDSGMVVRCEQAVRYGIETARQMGLR